MRYTSDLTDAEWQLIDYCFPKPNKKGRPREHSFRELLNAVFYVLKTGCQWRNVPANFAPWGTVYHYLRLWKRNGLWIAIHTHLREHVRLVEGRNRKPSAAIIDSQSVKSTESSDERGYDAGKKVNGRKRHILVDTIGLLLMVTVCCLPTFRIGTEPDSCWPPSSASRHGDGSNISGPTEATQEL